MVTETKHLKALKEIYSTLQHTDKISIRSVLKKHKISFIGCSVLKKGGIIENIGAENTPRYKWKTIKPNFKMANEWESRIRTYYTDYNKKQKPKQMKNNIDEKYLKSLNEIYTALQYTEEISIVSVMKKYKISKTGVNVLSKNNIIKRINTSLKYPKWKWNTTQPDQEMADNFLQMMRDYDKEKRKKVKALSDQKTKRKDNKQFASDNLEKPKSAMPKKRNDNIFYLDNITFKLLFIPIKIKLNYKTK